MTRRPKARQPQFQYDYGLIFITAALFLVGLLMVASASMVISDRTYGYPFHYLFRQGIFMVLGVGLIWLVSRLPMQTWLRISGYLMLLGIILLLAVLIPGVGRVINGSRRWIPLGIISLQVSE